MNPITIALASFGMSGRVFHGPLISANENFRLVKILERSRNESAEKYPDAEVVRHFHELCEDDRIELIVINTPDNTHYDLTREALASGKHVVVEKPFALKYRQAAELVETAGKKGLMLSVFHNRRWDGDFLTIRKIISERLLGRLVEYESHFDRYRNYIQEGTWKENPESGTGTLYNLGSHMIDQALVLFGKPESVYADIRYFRTGTRVDDSFEVWLRYPDIKVSVCGGYMVREQGPRYTLHGTEGSFLKWGIDPQEEALKQGKIPVGQNWGKEDEKNWGLLHTDIDGKIFRGKYRTLAGNYTAYYNNIFDVLRNGAKPAVSGEEAALVIKVIEAAYKSCRTARAIKI